MSRLGATEPKLAGVHVQALQQTKVHKLRRTLTRSRAAASAHLACSELSCELFLLLEAAAAACCLLVSDQQEEDAIMEEELITTPY